MIVISDHNQSQIKLKKAMDCFRIHSQFFLSRNFKRMIKFLLSFFVLSVLFSLLPFIIHSFKPFLMQFFSYYTVDKSYIFLLCNGLLVFIAMNSGLANPPSKSTIQGVEVSVGDNYESSRFEFNASEVSATVASEIVMTAEPQQQEENSLVIAEQENALSVAQEYTEEENEYVIIDEDGEEEHPFVIIGEDGEEEHPFVIIGEDGEEEHPLVIIDEDAEEEHPLVIIEEEVRNAMMIIDEHAAEETEELNKKCEDFIRKMKAAFCSEPRADYTLDLDNEKSLVLVN